jgi:protein TonB
MVTKLPQPVAKIPLEFARLRGNLTPPRCHKRFVNHPAVLMACNLSPATRVSENRFLQSFFAVSASAVLVSGTLLLLTSTAPWNPPQRAERDPSTPDASGTGPDATASIDIALPQAPLASDQGDTGDSIEPQMAAGAEAKAVDVPLLPQASSPEVEVVAALGTPLSPESADVSLDDDADASIAASAEAASDAGGNGPSAEVAVALPLAEVADLRRDTATDQIAAMLTALPPRPITSDKSGAATSELATALVAEPPAPPPPPASDVTGAAVSKVATALAASHPTPVAVYAPAAALAPKVAEVAGPPPPLPRRKPAVPLPEPKPVVRPAEPQAAPAKQELAKQDVAPAKQDTSPQATEQPRGGSGPWQAMALAPADKPVLKVPTARPNNAAYGSQVWAALARHKPRAGMRGSATVVFSIGENGRLRGVQVGRSSGNARIDQLALQTVRSAAPYPPPPAGVATYTIRIDFQ